MGKGKGLMPESPALRAKQTSRSAKAAQSNLLGLFFNIKGVNAFSQISNLEADDASDAPVVIVAPTPKEATVVIEPIETPKSSPVDLDAEDVESCDDFCSGDLHEDTYFEDFDADCWLSELENKKRGGAIMRSKAEDAHGTNYTYRKSEARIVRSNGSAHISVAASRKESARASEVSFAHAKHAANREKALAAKNIVRRAGLPPPVFAPTAAPASRPNYSRTTTSSSRTRTRRNRADELSPEDEQVAAAIRASLAENAEAFGGLTYQQLLELQTRDLTPEDYERLLMLDNTVKPKTLTEDMIAQFTRSKACCSHKEQLCTVCQMNYAEGEEILTLKCGHYFHADCITQWLSNSSTKCPIDGLSLKDD